MLEDPQIPPGKANLRAVALQILGEAYAGAKKEIGEGESEESEYVRVETKTSREREGKSRSG